MVYPISKILSFIKDKATHPLKTRELAEAMDIHPDEYSYFRKQVKGLIQSGELVKLKRGRIGLPDQLGVMVGTITITRGGTGFVPVDGESEDILITPGNLFTALDGDKVMVRLSGNRHGRESGVVIKIVERAERNIVGLFKIDRNFISVAPDNPKIHRDLYISSDLTMGAKNGDKVVARLTIWDDPFRNPEGEIIEVLGKPTAPGVDMKTVIRTFNLPEEFPDKVLSEAEQASAKIDDSTVEARLDLSSESVYTIDPSDAKDHDDAVSVEKILNGYRLGVHIADVSHFVQPGTALDDEAFKRGNSVYLPGMVVPMIPEVLSNNACSLKSNRRRLAFSVIIDFDKKGKMLSWELKDTIIKSKASLSYEQVQDYFNDNQSDLSVKKVAESLLLARELAGLLTKRRFTEGSLDFDLPEAKIILNDKGEVLELGNRVRLESHRLVEEFMLVANRAVALEVFRKGQPFIYRVHGKPDMEKLNAFSAMMKRLGYNFPISKTMKPIQFARFLDKIKDQPEVDFINELMLRSMQKAVYQEDNIGHFGLAFKHYTHFTSPIRRYPDLLVHRLLRKLKGETYPPAYAKRVRTVIDNVSRHCSETERNAEKAERQAIRVKQVKYMAKHIGDEFGGVISGVTQYGFYVRLDNMGVEGMVRVSTVDDDYYLYDESNYRIVGRRKKRSFRMGDAVKVGVLNVDTTRSEIELFVAAAKKVKKNLKHGITKNNLSKNKKPRPKKSSRKSKGKRKKQ